MRNIDRYEWDAASRNNVCDGWSGLFLDLELDDKLYSVFDKLARVAQCSLCAIAVVSQNQLDARSRGCFPQARRDRFGERHLRALTSETEPHFLWTRNQTVRSIGRLRDIASMNKGLQDAIDAGFRNFGSLIDVF